MNTGKHILAPALVCVLILSACAPAVSTPETEVPASSATVGIPTATPLTRPTATRIPTNTPVPTETPTPFVPKATIKIASHSPLTGGLSNLGTDIRRGAELASRQLADPLMKLGYKVELAPYDDQNDFGRAVDVAKQIAAAPETLCVVGPFTSRILNQVKEIYHQAGLPFVSPSTTAAFVAGSGYLEVNRLVGRNDGEGAAGAQFAKAQGLVRVFVISQNNDPAKFISNSFRHEVSRLSLTIVGNMATDAVKDFDQIIERVTSNNADLVYFSTLSAEQAGEFFREARAAGYMGVFMGPSSLDTAALPDFAGPLLIEGGGTYYTSISLPASRYPDAASFMEDFETLYGAMPQMFAAQAYDAAGVCLKAIEEASKAKAGEIPTRAEVANAIRALQDYKGITGTYNFDQNGDPNPATYFIFEVVSADPNHWDQNTLVSTFEIAPPDD